MMMGAGWLVVLCLAAVACADVCPTALSMNCSMYQRPDCAGSPALLMPGFSCAQGVCLACNASSVSTGNVTGNATGVSLGNGTLIALDPATSSSFSGCSINPSQCADAGLVYEVWIPRPGCTNLLGSRKSVFCAAASLGSMAAVVAAAVVAIVALL